MVGGRIPEVAVYLYFSCLRLFPPLHQLSSTPSLEEIKPEALICNIIISSSRVSRVSRVLFVKLTWVTVQSEHRSSVMLIDRPTVKAVSYRVHSTL